MLTNRTATNFRMSYVDSTLDAMNFTNKIFCSWSYSIMSRENADLLHKSIYFDLKVGLILFRKVNVKILFKKSMSALKEILSFNF